ncbi:MAG: ABC transporter permease [Candidatus Acidiferrales bacterium]
MTTKYISRRLIHAALLLLVISFLSFALAQLAPGDYFDEMRLNPQISPLTIDGLRSEYGLDRPFPVRYGLWLESVFKGQFGFSFASGGAVGPLLRVRARNTLLLTCSAALLAWGMAIPMGMWSALKRGQWIDRVCGVATSTLLTIPELLFFLCLLLLTVRTGWFPAGGMISAGNDGLNSWKSARDIAFHLLLPAFGLAIVTVPALIRHIRSAMIEALESPFVRAARGHGISRMRLLFRYALPVAANPLISLAGLSVATMLSASLLVEVIMSWPGLGPLMVEAILTRDVYVVIGIVMLSSLFLVAGNLLADLLLFASDPRIRVE